MTRDEFERHFRDTFSNVVGGRVVVALSGGADSVALLHLLRGEALGLELAAMHVHHGVRGAEADRDAAFCESLCGGLGVPFHLARLDPRAPTTSGREATWRELRYRALLDLARRTGSDAVATGHHIDDVAEGVLVQLLRGGGPRALAGIAGASGTVIRPLLRWSRNDIVSWLEERGLEWREDSSNRDLRHLRNLVRHRILPGLEEASPSIRRHLVHLAEALARDDRHFASRLEAHGSWIDPWEPDGGVPIAAVAGLEPPLRSRWLHAQAARIGLTRVTRRQAELVETMLTTGGVRAVTLGGRWRLRLAGGRLWLEPPSPPAAYRIDLVLGTLVDLPLPGWCVRLGRAADPHPGSRWRFDAHHPAGLVVRSPEKGDTVEVEGKMTRVSALLAGTLPRHLRNAWPVCCENDRIQWIPGVWQRSDIATGASHRVEVIRCERPASAVQGR